MSRAFAMTWVLTHLLVACTAGPTDPPTPYEPPPPPIPPLVASVEIIGGANGAVILVGATLQVQAIARDFNQQVVSIAPRWEVRPDSVAAITQTGLITGVSPGGAVVIAYVGGASGAATFSVVAASLSARR